MDTVTITKDNFIDEVLNSPKPVLLDFWASWCLPCRIAASIVEEIAAENPEAKVGKVNVDEERELVEAFNIMAMPTFVVLKDGKVVSAFSGVKPKAYMLDMLGIG